MNGNSLDCNSCFAAMQLGQLLFVYRLMFMSDFPFLVGVNELAFLALALLHIRMFAWKRIPVAILMLAVSAEIVNDASDKDTNNDKRRPY